MRAMQSMNYQRTCRWVPPMNSSSNDLFLGFIDSSRWLAEEQLVSHCYALITELKCNTPSSRSWLGQLIWVSIIGGFLVKICCFNVKILVLKSTLLKFRSFKSKFWGLKVKSLVFKSKLLKFCSFKSKFWGLKVKILVLESKLVKFGLFKSKFWGFKVKMLVLESKLLKFYSFKSKF